jgi:TrmH family RNA methyltransferase
MPIRLGIHADRLASVRALRLVKGRREQGRFAFEGTTLLEEARRSGFPIDELYCTPAAYDASALVRDLDASGIPVFIVDESRAAQISDLKTPSGVLAVAPMRLAGVEALLRTGGFVLVLADVSDPANAGSLLRSADAFGCAGVVFGGLGVDPYHPKVVRSSMGASFRLTIAVADPPELASAAASAGFHLVGLASGGACLSAEQLERPLHSTKRAVLYLVNRVLRTPKVKTTRRKSRMVYSAHSATRAAWSRRLRRRQQAQWQRPISSGSFSPKRAQSTPTWLTEGCTRGPRRPKIGHRSQKKVKIDFGSAR